MKNNLKKTQSDFTFKLNGDNEIDAILLTKTIDDMVSLIKITASNVDPEAYCKVKIIAIENGSFQIEFSTVYETVRNLLHNAKDNLPTALYIVNIAQGYFSIKKHLQGKKVKSIEEHQNNTTTIENLNGDIINIPKESVEILYNFKIDSLTSNIAKYSKEHNNKGFSIHSENKTADFPSSDIENMIIPLSTVEEAKCTRYTAEEKLIIKKPDFLGVSKWIFIKNKKSIEATIEDSDFLEEIHAGKNIKAGDYIIATLDTYIDLDNNNNKIKGSEKYVVTKVNGGLQHKDENQTSLF